MTKQSKIEKEYERYLKLRLFRPIDEAIHFRDLRCQWEFSVTCGRDESSFLDLN